jgi:membrane protease YdiL (CAAX protease family)
MFIGFAILGTGLGTRRPLGEVLARLGLRAPTPRELLAGLGIAFVLLCAEFAIGLIWQSLAPQGVFQDQNQFSGLIMSNMNTLTMAFLLAFTSAVGEEIAFRGALQPIFGLWPTAIMFALTHIQYTLTPAVLIILSVGLGLGWLRQRYNTTTAITAHFLYNFALIALVVYGQVMYDTLRSLQY